MIDDNPHASEALARLKGPLRLTLLGMYGERIARAFWPLWTILIAVAAALVLGLQDMVAVELVWAIGALAGLGALGATLIGIRRFRRPRLPEALERLDRTLPGRPIAALADTQGIGEGDVASVAVWKAHVARMAERTRQARPVRPDLRLAARDPFALRYVALTALAVALLFGSVWRVTSVAGMAPAAGATLATGPSWEGWIEPPAYTGKPALYLNDITTEVVRVPVGSRLSLRFYGQLGAIGLIDEVTDTPTGQSDLGTGNAFEGQIARAGRIELTGPSGRGWNIVVLGDEAPRVILSAKLERKAGGEMHQRFHASDDYAVVAGHGTIELDMDALDRRYGRAVDPEPREAIEIDLPLTISGDRADFEEVLVEDFSQHPWVGLPVRMQLTVEDAMGQTGQTTMAEFALPGRRFFDALANSIAEQRRDLLWSRENGTRVAQVLRAVSYKPEGFVNNEKAYLLLRVAIRRLEAALRDTTNGGLTSEARDEVAEMLWRAALMFEEGDLSSAAERLKRAQDRLSEAMRNGASDDEIADLMRELREAMQDYIRELAEQGQRDGEQQNAENQNTQEMTADQLQQMLDRLQQLMEEGRMAEAQQLMEMLRQMMENMQVTQNGSGQQSPGEQAMQDLAETLRDQQGLSDEAFRDLQEQFNPNAQAGQNQQNQGRDGGQGQGEQHDQQGQGQGNEGQQQQGQGGQPQQGDGGQNPGQQPGQSLSQSLAERQQQLRDRLAQQERNLPGAGTEEGDAAREALGRAGEAMDRAEEALRDGRMADALDNQAEAMEQMREGLRELGRAMAQQQQDGMQQGTAEGDPQGSRRDPLGREAGNRGPLSSNEEFNQSEDVYRRARELLDEIRRRSGEQARPEAELEYLKRLLDRF